MSVPELEEIIAYTDGSSGGRNIATLGGWAFRILYGEKCYERFGFKEKTTSNEMELIAILRVLEFVKLTAHPLTIFTDSQYARNSLVQWIPKWRASEWINSLGRPVSNLRLIQEIDQHLQLHYAVRTLEIKWLKGHVGHLNNERVDALASLARIDRRTNWTQPPRRVKVGT